MNARISTNSEWREGIRFHVAAYPATVIILQCSPPRFEHGLVHTKLTYTILVSVVAFLWYTVLFGYHVAVYPSTIIILKFLTAVSNTRCRYEALLTQFLSRSSNYYGIGFSWVSCGRFSVNGHNFKIHRLSKSNTVLSIRSFTYIILVWFVVFIWYRFLWVSCSSYPLTVIILQCMTAACRTRCLDAKLYLHNSGLRRHIYMV